MRKFGWLCFLALVFYAGYLYGTRPHIQKSVKSSTQQAMKVAQNALKEVQ
jgi:hypothetical protein